MKSVVKAVFVVSFICVSANAGPWDDPHGFPDTPRAGRQIERREPGWRTRARHETAAGELAAADRLRAAGRWRSAVRRYRAVVANWHDTDEAVTAQLRLAQTLEERQRHERAFNEYQYLMEFYLGRFSFTSVLERQFALAMHLAEKAGGGFLGRHPVDTPRAMLETLLENAPYADMAPSIKATLATLHEKDGAYDLAAMTYASLQQRYPGTPQANEAAYHEVRAMTQFSRKYSNDEALATETLARLRRYQARASAPERDNIQNYIEEVEQRVIAFWRDRAEFYDRIQKRPQSALIVYEEWLARFPEMDQADDVRARIETLRKKVSQ